MRGRRQVYILGVHRIAGLHEIGDEVVDSILLQANAHLEHVVRGCNGLVLPSAGDVSP